MASSAALALDPAPTDAVSKVAFNASSELVLTSTWGGSLCIHSAQTGLMLHESKPTEAAILDATWVDCNETELVTACLNGRLLQTCITNGALTPWKQIGTHQLAIRSVVSQNSLLVSGGWDAKICLWDVRSEKQTAQLQAGGKVYGMSNCGTNAVIFITSQRHVRILDLRNTSAFLHDKTPPTLTYQLRGVSASQDGKQYAVGSTEGRVAVEWPHDTNKESFSFKCHRQDGLAFPVNTIAHNPKYGSFATGGGDGHVSFWDGEARKRIAQYPRYPTSVACIDFDSKSQLLAVAVSYTFEEGEKDHPPDEVHIRKVEDAHIVTREAQQKDEISDVKILKT